MGRSPMGLGCSDKRLSQLIVTLDRESPGSGNRAREEPMPTTSVDLAQLSVNTIKFLSADAVEKAKSGHPGAPMGAADMAYVLWSRYLRFDPSDPRWPN